VPVEVSTRKAELLIRLNGLYVGGEFFKDAVYIARGSREE
jgi:hypothetical protein